MNVPAFSIPPLDELGEYDIGAWLWSKPEENSNNVIYGPHHVWIYHQDGNWFAGAASDGECLIAGCWNEDPENSNRPGQLLSIKGKHAPNWETWTLTNEQRTERIWSFLEVQAIAMKPRITIGKRDLGNAVKKDNAMRDAGQLKLEESIFSGVDLISLWEKLATAGR